MSLVIDIKMFWVEKAPMLLEASVQSDDVTDAEIEYCIDDEVR